MKKKIHFLFFIFSLSFGEGWGNKVPYFQQEVNYTINVKLDDEKHEFTADETIEYINNSPDELSFIYFHLWPNAYKNNGTALAKQLLEGGTTKFYYAHDSIRGYIDGLQFKADGKDVQWEYDSIHIDICKIKLNEPLKSGGKISISTPFHVKIPKGIFSRLGHIDQSYQITQWYPKPAVYDKYGWHQIPYLNQGEFYSEFGSFDVSITVPKNYVVGATGDLVNGQDELEWLNHRVKETEKQVEIWQSSAGNKKKEKPDMSFPLSSSEWKTLRYKQSKVHDFAWFADKRYHVLKGEVELPHTKRKVTTWAMFTNNEAHLWNNSIEYLNDAVYYYSLWNGDYPYEHATAVDGALSAGGGMEYPNITVIGESRTKFLLELVIMHEVGHNWFYGILGSNERVHGWMDEGLNSFNENRYVRTKYPDALILGADPDKKIFRIFDLHNLKYKNQYYLSYLFTARRGLDQPIELYSTEYSQMNYGAIMYSKTALVFDYLMAYLGEETMDKAMQKYFEEWKFKHPYPGDLRKILEDVSGKNLDWFFDDMLNSTKKLDYEIMSAKKSKCANSFTGGCTEVVIENVGEIAGPVSISAIKRDSIISTEWLEGFRGKDTVNIFPMDFDKIQIDGKIALPEIYQCNNTIRRKGILKKVEPLKLQFLGSVENPNKTQIFYSPVWGWNNYDKNMLGIAFYNTAIPQKNFEYAFSPMYSFEKKAWVGLGNIFYNWFPANNVIQNARLGINASSFDFSDFSYSDEPQIFLTKKAEKFTKIAPEAQLFFKKSNARSTRQHSLKIRNIFIFRDENYYFKSGNILTTYNDYRVNDIVYNFSESRTINPWGYLLNVQSGDKFLKTSLEINHRFEYKRNKGFDLRLFAGKFLFNNTNNPFLNWKMDGQNGLYDYTFDHIFLGRTETDGILSQQFNENNGAFKTPIALGQSNNWITSLNVKAEFPFKLPLAFFSDFGAYPYKKFTTRNTGNLTVVTTGVNFIYDAGIQISVVKNIFDVYVPLFYSEDIGNYFKANGLNFAQTIRFTLNIHKLNPQDLMRGIDM